MTAHGMGRSYLGPSCFGWRRLPGILDSDLWPVLTRCRQPTAALITDLGNDLVYGHSAKVVTQAAADAVGRLRDLNSDCRIVVTRPPLESVQGLTLPRYRFFRSVLFPMCRQSLSQIVDATYELDAGIQGLHGVAVTVQPAHWFGMDPIHIRRRFRNCAYSSFLESWPNETAAGLCTGRVPDRRPKPAVRWVFNRKIVCEQPSVITSRGFVSSW
ncbi:MAG: hypothetical protein MK102_07965 [Fuerstiella sp.]|nr:hypothetical protein [Fuerstiella sp.]